MNHSNFIINQRISLGGGRYFQRGLCKKVAVGDTFERELKTLHVTDVITIRDAKANNWTPEECKDAFYEVLLQEMDLRGAEFPLPNYTNTKKDTEEILTKYKII